MRGRIGAWAAWSAVGLVMAGLALTFGWWAVVLIGAVLAGVIIWLDRMPRR
jgi:hypothetical protein